MRRYKRMLVFLGIAVAVLAVVAYYVWPHVLRRKHGTVSQPEDVPLIGIGLHDIPAAGDVEYTARYTQDWCSVGFRGKSAELADWGLNPPGDWEYMPVYEGESSAFDYTARSTDRSYRLVDRNTGYGFSVLLYYRPSDQLFVGQGTGEPPKSDYSKPPNEEEVEQVGEVGASYVR